MITELIAVFHGIVNTLSQGNEMAAGLISVWLLTAVGYISRNLPKRIYSAIRRKIIISMSMDNSGTSGETTVQYNAFQAWFSKNLPSGVIFRNRRVALNWRSGGAVFAPAEGLSVFFFRGKFYWAVKSLLPSDGVEVQKERVTIYTFGHDPKQFIPLIEEFRLKRQRDHIRILVPNRANGSKWSVQQIVTLRDDGQYIMNRSVEEGIIKKLDWFNDNKKWYDDRHLAYKHTVLLYGMPGCGKTTLIRYIAARYKRDIYLLNLTRDGNRLDELVSTVTAEGGILAIEDFDDSTGVNDRHNPTNEKSKNHLGDVDISTLLNVLDGVLRLDNVITVLTTNHPEKIDPAITRPGRVDTMLEVTKLDSEAIHRYIKFYYRDQPYDESLEFAPMRICDLTERFMEHRFDVDAFINSLPKVTKVEPSTTHLYRINYR